MKFKQAALEFLKTSKVQSFKNAKHRAQWTSTLERYAFPVIGDLPLQTIDTALVLHTIMPVWERTPRKPGHACAGKSSACLIGRSRSNCMRVRTPHNGSLLKDHLPKKRKAEHHNARPFAWLGAFMQKLRERESSLSAKALEFTILTAARTNETIGMRWDEIDFASKVWTISAERMKADREHRVPLSDRALAVLASVPRNGSALVFPLSNISMLELLKGMSGNGYTVHGFRSTFSDWARDCTSYPRDVIEMALVIPSRTRAKPHTGVVTHWRNGRG